MGSIRAAIPACRHRPEIAATIRPIHRPVTVIVRRRAPRRRPHALPHIHAFALTALLCTSALAARQASAQAGAGATRDSGTTTAVASGSVGSGRALEAASVGHRSPPARTDSATPVRRTLSWYERLTLRGYAQLRYNRLLETNAALQCPACDKSIGRNGGFMLRRARLVFSGDVHERVSVYIQPDYGTESNGLNHYLQLRDAYFDISLDARRTHRLRLGQAKVPFGFENLQSSSNRIPLDRADATNTAVPNERDIGVFYLWAPTTVRKRFKQLVDNGGKGSGDYGVLAYGVVNGQTANRPEANNSPHQFVRLSYPWALGGQVIETGVQGYTGRFVLPTKSAATAVRPEYRDERAAVSVILYPRPVGLTAEWTWGRGPEYDAATRRVDVRALRGGYAQATWRHAAGGQLFHPFVRSQYYRGGRKVELDARASVTREHEVGVEWLPIPALELTAQYTISDRLTRDGAAADARQRGRFLRLQAQFNY